MKLTKLLFVCLLFALSINVTAQDIIKMKDSSEIKAKVEKITPSEITYKKTDNINGPDYVINKRDVESIIYANGVKEQINNGIENRFKKRRATSWLASNNINYGKNILSFAFFQATDASVSYGPGTYPGIGLHYERMLNRRSTLSFYLPVTTSFYTTYSYINNNTYSDQSTHPFFYMYPGFKYYPMGNCRRYSFSMGLSLAAGFGRKYHVNLNDTTGVNTFSIENRQVLKIGPMANTGIDIMLTRRLYVGAEFGFGFTFYDNDYDEDNNTDSYKNHFNALLQFNAKAGYRF
jgi:hypothetical protein